MVEPGRGIRPTTDTSIVDSCQSEGYKLQFTLPPVQYKTAGGISYWNAGSLGSVSKVSSAVKNE